MVQISWKEPEKKTAKAQKYKVSKPTEPVLHFDTFNFKLAVMEVLMYEKGLLAPKLDAHEFAREYSRRKIDIDTEGYEPIPEIRKWLRNTLSRSGWPGRSQRSRWMAAARFIPSSVRSGMARMEPLILIPLLRRNCASSQSQTYYSHVLQARTGAAGSGTVQYQGRLAVR